MVISLFIPVDYKFGFIYKLKYGGVPNMLKFLQNFTKICVMALT